jgi:hypothetical protein
MTVPLNFPYERTGNIQLFDYYQSTSIANGATGDCMSARLPSNFRRGFITFLGIGIDDPSAFALSTFQIKVNGIADKFYQQIQDQLSGFDDPKEIAPILVRPNDLIAIGVTNGNATAKLYAGRLKGFFDFSYNGA